MQKKKVIKYVEKSTPTHILARQFSFIGIEANRF